MQLLQFEPEVIELKEYIDIVKRATKDIDRREKSLQAFLEGRKLIQEEIDRTTDPKPTSILISLILLLYQAFRIQI
jgi:hypothetical protein